MEKPIKFSPLKINIKMFFMVLAIELFWIFCLRFWESYPWFGKVFALGFVVGTPYFYIKTCILRHESYQLISLILPELEEGALLPSDVAYIDESLKIIIYDHYLIGYAMGDCIDLNDIELIRVPVLNRSKSRTNVQVKSKSRGHFEIYTPILLKNEPISGLHRLANYLNKNFDIYVEVYD